MEMRAYHLQVNHLSRPVGIDGENLRVSWRLEGGIRHSAYQVEVKTKNGELLETTGKVSSHDMFCRLKKRIPWRSRAQIVLRILDESGKEGQGATLDVMTGIER